ncbi:MAG: glycine cleavage complex lipoylprotein [Promethearchaeota archaeon]|nr:MAG: glycine cleavage complex lipoylprotein [Candidatus Lokiarchaeota archaeon]
MDYKFPSDLKYTKTHEWVRGEDGSATVGITDYAQNQLGDIVFVEFPAIGDSFNQDDIAGEIESVKAVGELKLPLTGEITEINEEIEMKPELVNESPYEDGWLLKLKISDSKELENLLSVEEYKKLVEEEQD